jgi:hypothetical protein
MKLIYTNEGGIPMILMPPSFDKKNGSKLGRIAILNDALRAQPK